jgi:hypothetical protein
MAGVGCAKVRKKSGDYIICWISEYFYLSFGPYPNLFATNNWCSSVLLLSQESVSQNYFSHANRQVSWIWEEWKEQQVLWISYKNMQPESPLDVPTHTHTHTHTLWLWYQIMVSLRSFHDLSLVNKGCVNYTMALPFTLKSFLRQKKNYGNSNTHFTMPNYT